MTAGKHRGYGVHTFTEPREEFKMFTAHGCRRMDAQKSAVWLRNCAPLKGIRF